MSDDLYIWITRWEDFQHYRPERDRAPAWIKTYTKQLDDWRYLQLTGPQRGLLQDLRMCFARTHGELPNNTQFLSKVTSQKVRKDTLASLNQAGFIDFISRATLDQRLDLLYTNSSPHARPRARREGDEPEEPETEEPEGSNRSLPKTVPAVPAFEQNLEPPLDHQQNGSHAAEPDWVAEALERSRDRQRQQARLEASGDPQRLAPAIPDGRTEE